MSNQLIYQSLRAIFNTVLDIDKSYINQPYNPVLGTPYVTEDLLPNDTSPLTIRFTEENIYQGIYQITVYYPDKSGAYASQTKAEEIANLFSRGVKLYNNGYIQSVTIGSPFSGEGWYITPINVSYLVFA